MDIFTNSLVSLLFSLVSLLLEKKNRYASYISSLMYVSGRFPNEKLKSLEDEACHNRFFRLFWIAYITRMLLLTKDNFYFNLALIECYFWILFIQITLYTLNELWLTVSAKYERKYELAYFRNLKCFKTAKCCYKHLTRHVLVTVGDCPDLFYILYPGTKLFYISMPYCLRLQGFSLGILH